MTHPETPLEDLVQQAQNGSALALEGVMSRIHDDIYQLALKMLWRPEDAQDATQEILIRVMTHLGGFRYQSAFTTWVYRIAVNVLLTTRKQCAEQHTLSFEQFGQDLYDGLSDDPPPGSSMVEQRLLAEEIKRGCTQGMLLCLDRPQRIAYILGAILALSGDEAAEILEITPAAFRKRLSRARTGIRNFMQQTCGLVDPANGCRCSRRIQRAVDLGRIDPSHLVLAEHPLRASSEPSVDREVRELESLEARVAYLQRHPRYAAPEALRQSIKGLIASGRYQVFA